MAQTEQLPTNWETSCAMLGHQYLFWRSERVFWLPGCPEMNGVQKVKAERGWYVGFPFLTSAPTVEEHLMVLDKVLSRLQ